ncbi:MAG TPA: TIGR01777 family oxidoreductase [Candidatus Acidoferrales bacterium]|nr:TIGR01777 family oxidoreductase [Candidatus Acidoferrales bacterium]
MRIGVIGASGLIGRYLVASLCARGDRVVPASLRDPYQAALAVRDCDAVVNLAGEPILQRWTAKAKRRMWSSRVEGTAALNDALALQPRRPPTLVNASAIGVYGDDFLSELCVAWERAAESASECGMRVAIVRFGIVLARDGGALATMLPAFRLGLGGPIGSGRQWMSWVHIADAIGILQMALDGARGVFDATAPAPVTNAEFTRALGAALHRPAFFTVPGFALRLLFGEGARVLTTGERVLPQQGLDAGYVFRFTNLEDALGDLLR